MFQVVSDTGSALVNEIAKARDNIKQSLAGMVCTKHLLLKSMIIIIDDKI